MNRLDFEIKYDVADKITLEDALKNEDMVNNLNYLIEEGFIEIEEDADGEIRAYPVST